jgi:hypothetical protein
MAVKLMYLLVLNTMVMLQHMHHQQLEILVWAGGETVVALQSAAQETTFQFQQHGGKHQKAE